MDYLYDNTFEGLLSCLYHNVYLEKCTGIYDMNTYQVSLLNQSKNIKTDNNYANKMYDEIKSKVGNEAIRNIYRCFLSGKPNKENIILQYVNFGYKIGRKITNYHSHPQVNPLLSLCKKVDMEGHRYLGYVRFNCINNILYSSIHPENNILPIIASHFSDRYGCEKFIIHDKNRSIAIISNFGKWVISDFNPSNDITIDNQEAKIQKLWKNYFETIGIEYRKNKKLQQNFVPLKYRKDLIEFD